MRAFTIFSISMTIGAVALGIVGCKPTAMDETTTATSTAHETLASPVVDKPSSGVTTSDDAASDEAVAKKPAEAIAPISLSLTPGDPESKLAPRYSPPGKGLSLTAVETSTELGVDGLQTEVQLGSPLEKVTPVKLLVTRAAADAPYSKLYCRLGWRWQVQRTSRQGKDVRLARNDVVELRCGAQSELRWRANRDAGLSSGVLVDRREA